MCFLYHSLFDKPSQRSVNKPPTHPDFGDDPAHTVGMAVSEQVRQVVDDADPLNLLARAETHRRKDCHLHRNSNM